ncbi:MAG TPA: GNAT family N-acetyltransferase [Puia sp.]|jgi:ribosomal protein S18 acetylase RimI-like enzyme|nr:GNAT family N-acetyltransferase [Puia sp.]
MQPTSFIITDFQPAHQPAFQHLYQEWFTSALHQPTEPADDFVLTQPEKAILQKGGAILVASENGEIAGFVALKKTGASEMELTKMIIRPESRGKGLGEILCRGILARGATLGAASVILYSHSSLQAALALYRKLGFQDVRLEQCLYSSFRCDIKMKKWLIPAGSGKPEHSTSER